MTATRRALPILLAAVLGHLALWSALVASKHQWTHDEGISYLAATGHQAQYAQIVAPPQPPYAAWTPARTWQVLLRPQRWFAFVQIGHDLAYHDIHPPLYFWLLHLACLACGTTLWVGPFLNLLLDVAGMFVLFGCARFVLRDAADAAWAVLLWSISPAVLLCATQARQYPLLAVLTIAMVWLALRTLDATRAAPVRTAVALTAVTTAALLTHYHAVIPASGLILLAAMHLRSSDGRRGTLIGAAIALATLLFVCLHPAFFHSFVRERIQAHENPFSPLDRLQRTAPALLYFFTLDRIGALVAGVAITIAASVGLMRWWRQSRRWRELYAGTEPELRRLLGLTVWIATLILVLYLSGVSPDHAMAPPYLSMVYPLLAIALVAALRQRWWLPGLVAFVFINSVSRAPRPVRQPSEVMRWTAGVDRMVIDNPARGILPRIIWHLAPEQLVYAAREEDLLKPPTTWLDELTEHSVWISEVSDFNTPAHQAALQQLIAHRFSVRPVGSVYGVGTVFQLGARGR